MRREMALAVLILGVSFPCFSEQGMNELDSAAQASQAAAGASSLGAARDLAARPVDGNEVSIPGVVAGSGAAVKARSGLTPSAVKTDARPALSLKSRRPSRASSQEKGVTFEEVGAILTGIGCFVAGWWSLLAFAGVLSGGWVVGAVALGVCGVAGIASLAFMGL